MWDKTFALPPHSPQCSYNRSLPKSCHSPTQLTSCSTCLLADIFQEQEPTGSVFSSPCAHNTSPTIPSSTCQDRHRISGCHDASRGPCSDTALWPEAHRVPTLTGLLPRCSEKPKQFKPRSPFTRMEEFPRGTSRVWRDLSVLWTTQVLLPICLAEERVEADTRSTQQAQGAGAHGGMLVLCLEQGQRREQTHMQKQDLPFPFSSGR